MLSRKILNSNTTEKSWRACVYFRNDTICINNNNNILDVAKSEKGKREKEQAASIKTQMKLEAKAIYYMRNNIPRESFDTYTNGNNNNARIGYSTKSDNLEMELLKFEKGE